MGTNEHQKLLERTQQLAKALASVELFDYASVFSDNQSRRVVNARAMLTYTLYKAGASCTELGKVFDRSHSTILYYIERVNRRLTQPKYASYLTKRIIYLQKVNRELVNQSLKKTKLTTQQAEKNKGPL